MVWYSPTSATPDTNRCRTPPTRKPGCAPSWPLTTLGPGLGGTRIRDYDTEDDALEDVLRLSRAMTCKAAAADLPLGGAKAVVLGDPDGIKSGSLLEAYGRAVDCMVGRYLSRRQHHRRGHGRGEAGDRRRGRDERRPQ